HEATDLLPVVVVGSFRKPDESARFIALGANKVLFKSARPDEIFAALDEVLGGRSLLAPMISGNPSLREFAARLVSEVERAFIDGADEPLQSLRIPVGDGADIQAAWWSAIARVQEIVSHRTEGQISFSGPWGHLAASPWLDVAGSERLSRSRGAAEDVSLEGKRVLVVDDDPSIAWFLGDLLRNAGCIVQEANDGAAALEFAFSGWPDLVLSDILMPKLDGFGLLRILRRDVALRDVPVILLSWKEDLLQRMRELGADATGYLRKESDSRAVVARIREALWLRSKVENRIATGGVVRGRLDELSVASLLRWVTRSRPNAHLLLQDAAFVYEVEVRDGRLVSVERQAPGRNVESGAYVLEALLGVGSARFTVTTASDPVVSSFAGSLEQILGPIFLHNRSAMRILSGNGIRTIDKIELDLDRIRLDLRAFPDAARELLEAFASAKDSPGALLERASIDPVYFEQILTFVVSRGAVRAIYKEGVNLLAEPATELSHMAVYEERENDLVSLASYASHTTASHSDPSALDGDAMVAELLSAPAQRETLEVQPLFDTWASSEVGSPRLRTEVEQVVEVEVSAVLSPLAPIVVATPSVPVEFEPLLSPSPHAPVTTSLAPSEMDAVPVTPQRRKLWTGLVTASVFAALFAWGAQSRSEPSVAPASQVSTLPEPPTEERAPLREVTPDELPLLTTPVRDAGIHSK
ncbi:MAG: response regulator, partial [Polyangiaceae bacterium]|nr:response regulator [Polyangiaceae bacterium]